MSDRPSAPFRLLFVINAAITGGAERHTATLARNLGDRFTSTIFAIKRGTESPDGIDFCEPTGSEGLVRRIRTLAKVIDDGEYDLIVPVNQRPLAIALLGRLLARRQPPVAVIFHTTILRNRKEEAMQRIYTPLFNRAQCVVFISANQGRHWAERGLRPQRAVTILNGIDPARFSSEQLEPLRGPTRLALGLAATDFVIGCNAVLRAEKNHLQLVEAVALLRARSIPARALMVGDGPTRHAIEERARALDVADHVILTGMQSDVRPYVAAFDVGALCSTSIETLSLSALESLAAGVPMVMSDIGGASEILDGSNGRIFPVGDTESLVAALQTYWTPSPRQRAGIAARQTVALKFNIHNMIIGYTDIFISLITGRATPAPVAVHHDTGNSPE